MNHGIKSSDKVLVTGAGGFIGSHLTEALVRAGADVRAMAHYNSRNDWGNLELLDRDILGDVHVVAGDITDGAFVRSAMKDRNIVFHLAALIAIPYSYAAPESYVGANVTGTLHVLQAARELGTERVLHTSTSEVYGTARFVPITEEHPLQGQSPYSASKIGADKLAESFYRSFETPVVTIRPFNTFGPRQSARAIIPAIAVQVLTGQPVKLGSLAPVRDLNFVDNTVEGYLLAAKSQRAVGQAINLATGAGVTIGDLAHKIFDILGVQTEIQEDAQRLRTEASEVLRPIGSAEKANELLGWTPRLSLDDGLKITLDWFRENLRLYKAGIYNV
jgi:NAD dependent epimerase/dehydratase